MAPTANLSTSEPARDRGSPVSPQHVDLLALQRSVGNRGTVGLIQQKLEVGSVDDPLEVEADHIAQQVLRRISAQAGQELLAHELTHVVEQGAAIRRSEHRPADPPASISVATIRRRQRDIGTRATTAMTEVIQRDDLVSTGSNELDPANSITAAIEGLSPFIRPFFECLWRAIQDGRLRIDETAARQLVWLLVALQRYASAHEDEAEEIHDSGGMILPPFIALSGLVAFLVHTNVTEFLDGNEIFIATSWATENLGPIMADFLHSGVLVRANQPSTGAANGQGALTGRGPVPALEGPRPEGPRPTPLPDIRTFLRNQAQLDRMARQDPEYQAGQMAQHLPPGGFEYLIGFRNDMLLAFTIAIMCKGDLRLAGGLMPTCIAAVQARMANGTLVEILDRALRNNGREHLIVSLLRLLEFDGRHILSFLDSVGPNLAALDNMDKLYSALQIFSQSNFDATNLQAWIGKGMQPANRRQQEPSQSPTSPGAPKTALPLGVELVRLPDSALERLVGRDEFRLIREKIGTQSRPYSPNPFLADQCITLLAARNNLADVVALLKFFIDNLDTAPLFEQAVKTTGKLLEKNFARNEIETFCTNYRPLFCLADVHEPIAQLATLISFDLSAPTLASLNIAIPGLQGKGLTMAEVADLVKLIKVRRNSAPEVLEVLTICSTNAAVGNSAQAGQAIKSVCPMYQYGLRHSSVKLLLNNHMTQAVLPDMDLVLTNLCQHAEVAWNAQDLTDTVSLITLLTGGPHNMAMNGISAFLNTNAPPTLRLRPKALLDKVTYLLAPSPAGRGATPATLGNDFANFGARVDTWAATNHIPAQSAAWAKAAFRFLRCTPDQAMSYLQKQVVRNRCTGNFNTDAVNHLLLFARNFRQRGAVGVVFAPLIVNVAVGPANRQVQITDWIVHHVLERHSFQYFDFGDDNMINRAPLSTMFQPDATDTAALVGAMLSGLLGNPAVAAAIPGWAKSSPSAPTSCGSGNSVGRIVSPSSSSGLPPGSRSTETF